MRDDRKKKSTAGVISSTKAISKKWCFCSRPLMVADNEKKFWKTFNYLKPVWKELILRKQNE